MSHQWPGGLIRKTPPTPAGPFQDGAAPGVWTLDQMTYWLKQGLWPIAGNVNTGNIGLFGGGSADSNISNTNVIDRITISTTGNAVDYGDLTVARRYLASFASVTRAVWGGGNVSQNVIDYVTISTSGNAVDFGDLLNNTNDSLSMAGCNSSTRGVFGGGTFANVIQYVTIASIGNAIDFGDLTLGRNGLAACSSPTRGVFAAGNEGTITNVIDFITIASTGNATDFGDVTNTNTNTNTAGCSSSTRGLVGGGNPDPGNGHSNAICYITIATTGNAIDFGDLAAPDNQWRGGLAACSSPSRGVFAGGYDPTNTINFVTIATTGNASDFGDLSVARQGLAGCSGGNGGVQ
jgi:hypothetical protein